MLIHGLRVVIEDDIGDTRVVKLFDRFAEGIVVPGAEDDEIGVGGDDLFDGKSAIFGVADVGDVFQLGQGFFIKRILLRPPVFPGGKRKGDDFVHGVFAADGEIVFVVEAENDTFRHFGDGHGAAFHVSRGQVGVGGERAQGQRGGKEQFFHAEPFVCKGKCEHGCAVAIIG